MSKDLEEEVIEAILVCLDLLNIDVRIEYPKIYSKWLNCREGEKI